MKIEVPGTAVVVQDEGYLGREAPMVLIEMLQIDFERKLNRCTYRDGTVRVSSQHGYRGAWLQTQAVWDEATKDVPRFAMRGAFSFEEL